ncbi:MAG: MATE family efflux transporter, partial [Peptostreptococcaceae bacterium]
IDRIFIGRMPNGEIAMAGIGITMPIILLVAAFSALLGAGGAPLAAIKMGEKKNDEAEKIMTNSLLLLILSGIVLTIVFLLFKEPILWAFGASSATIGYGMDYLSIYLIGTIFVQIALGMSTYITTQGFAKEGMIAVAIGAAINIILDPIFIFGLGLGVKGAALATISAQFVSGIYVMKFLLGKKSILKIKRENMKLDFKIVGPIVALGIAPFIMQSTECIVLISLNNQLSKYGGDLAIGAMAIMSSIMQMITLPLAGFTQGAQPIISYNFGAGNLDRVRKTFKLLLGICLAFSSTVVSLLMIFPEAFVSIFNNNPELMKITSWSIRIYFSGMFVIGIQMTCQQTFLALGQAKLSLMIALLRKMLLLVPLIFILPNFMDNGLQAVLTAEPIADITACLITVIAFARFYKKTLSEAEVKAEDKLETSINCN